MPSSLNGTGVTFNDGTTQSTAAVAGGGYNLTVFTSSGTWTKPTGLKAVKVTVIGAGGNGGTAFGPYAGVHGGSGGGGGGAIEEIQSPSIPGPVSVTVGTAPSKTSSFGSFLSATGGTNGANSAPNDDAPSAITPGGAGFGGDVNFNGGSTKVRLRGGDAALGFGFGSFNAASNGNDGLVGLLYGGGGSGGIAPGTRPGGAGAAGIVVVEEFY